MGNGIGIKPGGTPRTQPASNSAAAAMPGKVSLVQQLPVVQLAPAAAASKPDNHVDLYLKVNENHVWPAVRDHFASLVWPTPDPRISWDDQRRFAQKLAESLSSTVHFDEPSQLREVVFPANPVFVLEPLYPGTNTLWVPTMGTALGQMLQDAIIPSLARIGLRWVAAAQHAPNPEAATDPTAPLVHYNQIITSAPIDRVVAFALCAAGSVWLAGGTAGKAVASKPQPLRVVKTLEWQGGRDRSLWNWVKAVDPPDATAEEIAAALFKRHDGRYSGEATSFDAYALTTAPPMFGVPPSWARSIRGAKDHAPAPGTTDESQPGRWAALGRDKASDAIALAEQGRPGPKAEVPQAAALLKTLGDSVLVVRTLLGHLMNWRLAAPVGVAYSWLLGKESQIATMSQAELAQWAPIVTAQQDRLGRIVAGGIRYTAGAAAESAGNAAGQLAIQGGDMSFGGAFFENMIWEQTTQPTREDLKRERPELFASGAPATRFIDTVRGRKLYFEVTDMDLVVTQDNASGKRKVVHREELKTGTGNRPGKARAQLDTGAAAMTAAANGGPPVALFESDKDITPTIDLSSVAGSTSATRGPAGKGFDKDFGINAKDLDALADELLKLARTLAHVEHT